MVEDASRLARLRSESLCNNKSPQLGTSGGPRWSKHHPLFFFRFMLTCTSWTVNLGPIQPTLDLVPAVVGDPLQYNPRCMRRAFSKHVSTRWSTTADLLDLLLNPLYSTIRGFQNRLSGDFINGYLGQHAGGHFSIGGDPQGDLYSAPGDPAFWPHHTQVDRVWFIWQLLGEDRFMHVDGTLTFANIPPSRNGTLDDIVDMGAVSPVQYKIRELVSTVDGPFCYIYL
jgi:tyrosinase